MAEKTTLKEKAKAFAAKKPVKVAAKVLSYAAVAAGAVGATLLAPKVLGKK